MSFSPSHVWCGHICADVLLTPNPGPFGTENLSPFSNVLESAAKGGLAFMFGLSFARLLITTPFAFLERHLVDLAHGPKSRRVCRNHGENTGEHYKRSSLVVFSFWLLSSSKTAHGNDKSTFSSSDRPRPRPCRCPVRRRKTDRMGSNGSVASKLLFCG